MVRPFLATLGLAALAAWAFSPSATGAPQAALASQVARSTSQAQPVPNPDRVGTRAVGLQRSAVLAPPQLEPVASGAKRQRRPPLSSAYPAPTEPPPTWVTASPKARTQHSKSSRDRGINPCMSPDPGFGNYERWDRSPSIGQMIIPKDLQLDAHGEFPLMVHFHGHEPARKAWVQAVNDAVLVGVDLGNNSGPYLRKFAREAEFTRLLESVEAGVAAHLGGKKARIGKLGLSSWSAGYGAVERALRSSLAPKIDAVILLDGLHTGHAHTERARRTLAPFVRRARKAASGDGLMFVSHSSIIPPTYASTTETANYLIWQLGGVPEKATERGDDPMGLELFREYNAGDFHIRGFTGNGKLDHCAHLGLYERVLRERLAPRWGLRTVTQ